MIRPLARFYYGPLSIVLSFYVGSCGGSAPSNLEKVFGAEGESYCESLNRAVEYSLQSHLSASEEDLPQIYHDAIRATLAIAMPILSRKAATEIRSEILNEGSGPDSERLSTCEDLAIIARLRAANPIFQGVHNLDADDAPHESQAQLPGFSSFIAEDAKSRFNLAQSDSIFKIFLLTFVSRLDFFSRFSSLTDVSLYFYGVKFAIDANVAYGKPLGDFVTVEAVAPQIDSISPGDQVSAIEIDGAWQPIRGMSSEFLKRSLYASKERSMTVRILSKPGDPTSPTTEVDLVGFEVKEFERSEPLVRGELLGDAAFIRIFKFQPGTTDQLIQEIWRIQSEWEKTRSSINSLEGKATSPAIVLDLQFNPGGSLDEALSLLGLFVPYQRVGTIETKHSSTPLYPIPSAHRFENPLFVIVNHASASASELVTQVLQETGRATVIGERTFGKGIGQQSISLGLGSAFDGLIQLTTFRFFGPSGRSIQMKGLTPDLEIQNSEWRKWRDEAEKLCNPEDQSTLKSYCFQRMEDLPRYLGEARAIPATQPSASKSKEAANTEGKRVIELSEFARLNFENQTPTWRDSESNLLQNDMVRTRAVDIANLWALDHKSP